MRLWTARAFQVVVCGRPDWLPAGRTKPLSDGRPRPTRSWRDCGTDCNIAVRHDSSESIVCHAVEAHRFPETPSIHTGSSSRLPGVLVMVGLGPGAVTPYRIHHLLALIRTSFPMMGLNNVRIG